MENKPKRWRKPKEGDVLAIPMPDGKYGFCQVCNTGDYAFFDWLSSNMEPVEIIINHPVAFRVPVAGQPDRECNWIPLGRAALVGELSQPALYRNQPVGSNQLFVVRGNDVLPAAIDEVKNLEIMAWWFGYQLVQRLQDHFAGRPNKEVEFMRRIKVYDPVTGQEIKY